MEEIKESERTECENEDGGAAGRLGLLLYLSPPRRFPNGLFGSDKKSKGKKSNKNVQVKNDK
jgi:hypothetical protein